MICNRSNLASRLHCSADGSQLARHPPHSCLHYFANNGARSMSYTLNRIGVPSLTPLTIAHRVELCFSEVRLPRNPTRARDCAYVLVSMLIVHACSSGGKHAEGPKGGICTRRRAEVSNRLAHICTSLRLATFPAIKGTFLDADSTRSSDVTMQAPGPSRPPVNEQSGGRQPALKQESDRP